MPIPIVDGKGSGRLAEVNSENQLVTKAVVETDLEFHSEHEGQAFSWNSGTYDGAAGDTALLVKNTAGDLDLHIDHIVISIDIESRVVIHLPTTEVTVAGTTITGTNLNTGSSNVAEAGAARDETGNAQGNIVWTGELQAASEPHVVDLPVVLSKNKSIGVDIVGDFGACDITIVGHYAEKSD